MQTITNVRKNTAGHTQKEASLHPQESLPSTHTLLMIKATLSETECQFQTRHCQQLYTVVGCTVRTEP